MRDSLKNDNIKLVESCDMLKKNNEDIKGEYEKFKEKNLALKKKIDTLHFTESSLKNNDKMVKYYTGLPDYGTLLNIFEFVFPAPQEGRSSLTTFQQFCAVLAKLRLVHNYPLDAHLRLYHPIPSI